MPQVTENAQDQSEIPWGRCESIEDCGGAFWRKEVAQFLASHRCVFTSNQLIFTVGSSNRRNPTMNMERNWRGKSMSCQFLIQCSEILKSSTGIRLIQVRITEDTSSPNLAKLWNLTRHASSPELPMDASQMQGCIVYHKLFGEPQKRLSVTKILRNAFSRLKVPTLKVVVLDCNGYVFEETVPNNHPKEWFLLKKTRIRSTSFFDHLKIGILRKRINLLGDLHSRKKWKVGQPTIAEWGVSTFSSFSKYFLAFRMLSRVAEEAKIQCMKWLQIKNAWIITSIGLSLTDCWVGHYHHDIGVRCKDVDESWEVGGLQFDSGKVSAGFAAWQLELFYDCTDFVKPVRNRNSDQLQV